ncbi:ABC transporter permease [Acinetobacter sp. C_4_1]|uniref:ABC transporter permease n=1 Tax=unclassified Acinetobacter TaxID=196816 RepID=UPI0021B775B3|nr:MULTISPECIES: ABC transporter permease [unclassified Acinetobacter]MCT8089359.1 ABC transporter permease [Acinetobacter sp. F_3_1]MCT8096602.1 ABC transporter permease [Acinetobacter sp. C_3_1]MCT8100994.1 ABC transporter permease [Acinetobacter sp. C_4_1]MCT8134691.1 ABC transporter permease [Acinetobacter sp. T_3_1]
MSSTQQAIPHSPTFSPSKPRLELSWLNTIFKRSIAIILFLLLWETLPRTGVVSPAFLPPLSTVLETAWQLYQSGQLGTHFFASIRRSIVGFVLALAIAIPLGLVIGWYKLVAETLNPLLELFRNTTALALMPLFILFLGIGEASKISLLVYACTWPILLNTITGVQTVDPLLIKSARTMGLKPYQLFRKVILPASVPTIFVGIRLAGAISILALVAVEMFGAKAGLGYLIMYSQFSFEIPQMFVGILVITLVGLSFNYILIGLEKYFTAWKRNSVE